MASGTRLGSESRLSGLADGLKGHRIEIVGLLVTCWGLVASAATLGLTEGALVTPFCEAMFDIFGVGAPAIGPALVVAGLALVLPHPARLPRGIGRRLAGLGLLWLAILVAAELIAPAQGWRGSYGGAIGYWLGGTLKRATGSVVAGLVALAIAAEGLHLMLRFSWRSAGRRVWRLVAWVARWWRHQMVSLARRVWAGIRPARPRPREVPPAVVTVSEAETKVDLEDAGAVTEAATEATQEREAAQEVPEPAPEVLVPLPPMDLFDAPVRSDGSGADEAIRATIIEDTLSSFGIPAKVKEVQRGPAFTRFGLEPGYVQKTVNGVPVRRKIRVNKIKALVNDLSLALSASPIRVEAPIPGRPLVGIEVPNSAVSLVRIRELLESPEYQGGGQPLLAALGKEVSGRAFVVPISRLPHLLIAGATGTGKSVCISAIITSLLFANRPAELRLILVDRKQVELTRYNGIPHLLGRVETTVEGAVAALRWACKEMDSRYTRFEDVGVRDLAGYNELPSVEKLPRFVIIVDELADLMLSAPEDAEKPIVRLAQMGRAVGIHLILATQRPSVDVVTGLIKANIPARISFAMASQTDSRVILDSAGAEDLMGQGDMLFVSPDSGKQHRLQGAFVSEEETRRLVEFWARQIGEGERLPVAPWSGMIPEEEDHDQLFDQAVAVAREVSAVSASFLQRRLRIGYPRAAHLLSLLEEAGIVGPATGGGRSRPVLQQTEDELFEEGELDALVNEEDE